MRWIVSVLAAAALAASVPLAVAQGKKEAAVHSASSIQSQLSTLTAKARSSGSAGTTLSEFGNQILMLSVRTKTGKAELHGHYDDVLIVKAGHATLVTGGKLVAPETEKNGEVRGKSIAGGESREVGPGDVLDIPAGTPHQFLIPPDTVLSSLVIKVKE